MKFYCLDFEECGYEDISFEPFKDRICPSCCMPMVAYELNTIPIWRRAPYGAQLKEENDRQGDSIK